jgi:hypothetical protein
MEKVKMVQVMKDIYKKYPNISKDFGTVTTFNALSKDKYREKLEEALTWRDTEEERLYTTVRDKVSSQNKYSLLFPSVNTSCGRFSYKIRAN